MANVGFRQAFPHSEVAIRDTLIMSTCLLSGSFNLDTLSLKGRCPLMLSSFLQSHAKLFLVSFGFWQIELNMFSVVCRGTGIAQEVCGYRHMLQVCSN